MPTLAKDHTKVDFRTYSLTLGGFLLGWMNDVDPSALKLVTAEKTIGEIGAIAIDQVIIGMQGTVKAEMAQTDITALRAATPWAPATGSIPLTPTTQYQSLYQYAKELVIHPRGVATSVEDLTLLKAVPLPTWMKMSDGKKQRGLPLEFLIFPDVALLTAADPILSYGYIGPTPA